MGQRRRLAGERNERGKGVPALPSLRFGFEYLGGNRTKPNAVAAGRGAPSIDRAGDLRSTGPAGRETASEDGLRETPPRDDGGCQAPEEDCGRLGHLAIGRRHEECVLLAVDQPLAGDLGRSR